MLRLLAAFLRLVSCESNCSTLSMPCSPPHEIQPLASFHATQFTPTFEGMEICFQQHTTVHACSE